VGLARIVPDELDTYLLPSFIADRFPEEDELIFEYLSPVIREFLSPTA